MTLSHIAPVAEAAQENPHDASGKRSLVGAARARLLFVLRQPTLLFAYIFLVLVIVAALYPELFTDFDPYRSIRGARLKPPGALYWFGTDHMGRDLFTRVVFGTAESIKAVILAVLLGCCVGSTVGLIAAYVGRWVDDVLMRAMDVLLAVPSLLVSLAIINALGFGTVNVAIAVGIASVASFARVMRSEALRIRSMPYVEAATFSGVGHFRVLRRYIVPNAFGPVLSLATIEIGWAVLSVSALSFLGFGAPPPTPEWGALVANGREYMGSAWWLTTLPGVVIALSVLSVNRIARSIDSARSGQF